MKTNKIILSIVFYATIGFLQFVAYKGACQNVGINVTGAAGNSKALLDIDASTMSPKAGLLLPRMTTAERNAISGTIPESLLIYNTDTKCFEAYNSSTSAWVSFGCIGCQPGAFTASAATSITSTSFFANWSVSNGAANYYLDVATDAGFTSFVSGFSNLNVGNITSYNVTGLTSGTYYYRVRSNNSCGTSANSNTITVGTTVFSYTGGQQSWVVPAGVTSITVDMKGGAGSNGAKGGRVQTILTVSPGETIYIYVGGAGAAYGVGGYNGGGSGGGGAYSAEFDHGGGGASDIRQGGTALSNRVIVAGGGGGAGSGGCAGGAGGGTTGANGSTCSGGGGGNGGTSSAGGSAGSGYGSGSAGIIGSSGSGGNGGSGAGQYPGGGGGGGYYGGGGAGGSSNGSYAGGGGGGGSSYAGAGTSSTTHTQGYASATGNGQVIISW